MKWFINAAISFDGMLSLPNKQINISSKEDWQRVHQMRNQIAAIVVGSNTIIVDNPSLKTSNEYVDEIVSHPVRIIFDRRGKIPNNSKVFHSLELIPTIWVTNSEKNIPDVIKIEFTNLEEVMFKIERELLLMNRTGDIMIEGGAKLINAFINSGLISDMRLYRSPILLPGGVQLFPKLITKKLKLNDVNKLGSGMEEFYTIY